MNKKIRSPGLLNYPVTVVESYVSEGLFVKDQKILFVLMDQEGAKFTVRSQIGGEVKSVFFAYGMVLRAPSILCEISEPVQNPAPSRKKEEPRIKDKPESGNDSELLDVGWFGVFSPLLPAIYISYWSVAIFLNGRLSDTYFESFNIRSELLTWPWYLFVAFAVGALFLWFGFLGFSVPFYKYVHDRRKKSEKRILLRWLRKKAPVSKV